MIDNKNITQCPNVQIAFLPELRPLCSKKCIYKDYVGYHGEIFGFGRSNGSAITRGTLRKGSVKIISNFACYTHPKTSYITNDMICAVPDDYRNNTICTGDYGGGLVIKNRKVLIAIASYGNCDAKQPGVYIRITHHLDWIYAITGIRY